ncbi:membrane protein insertion efficiency factor YidD [candidate division TA06 bacterium]|uniref:Membrane protein insertion efficiency factor YidD n=1 Tax=candidate division TA06 bacterium TaxID=2250710 RepID=A0A933MKL8_UNCT6|nr:membrane protein insertion efficiency factor YidD [candidate division TA06 bacterium]
MIIDDMSRICYSLIILFCAFPGYGLPNNGLSAEEIPWSYQYYYNQFINDPVQFNKRSLPFTQCLLQNFIVLYQRNYSKSSCQFVPSCSRYSYLSFELYSQPKAVVNTLCRLWRCNGSTAGQYQRLDDFYFDPPLVLAKHSDEPQGEANVFQPDYINWLINKKEWTLLYQHCTEREYRSPSSSNRLLLTKTALQLRRYDRALLWIKNEDGDTAAVLRAITHFRMGQYGAAKEEIARCPLAGDLKLKGQAFWLHSFIEQPEKQDTLYLVAIARDTSNTHMNHIALRASRLLQERPRWPSVVSSAIIPGAGQAANGFPTDGLFAFVFVAGTGAAAAHDLRTKNYGGTALWGLGFIFSYASNLVSAAQAPRKRNIRYIRQLHAELNQLYTPGSNDFDY